MEVLDESQIQSIIKRFEEDELEYQQKYDYDTYHSFILKEQKKYERQIDSLISSLQNFEKPIVSVK